MRKKTGQDSVKKKSGGYTAEKKGEKRVKTQLYQSAGGSKKEKKIVRLASSAPHHRKPRSSVSYTPATLRSRKEECT